MVSLYERAVVLIEKEIFPCGSPRACLKTNCRNLATDVFGHTQIDDICEKGKRMQIDLSTLVCTFQI